MAVAYRVAGRVPDALLPRVGDGMPVPVRGRPREAVVHVFTARAREWQAYLHDLADRAADLADWDGRVIAVTPRPDASWRALAADLGDRVWVVADPEALLEPGDGGVRPVAMVADRYGEIYHVWPEDGSPPPGPRELEEWLKFLALQCPE